MTKRVAYGPAATYFAQSIDANEPVVVFDHIGVPEAVRDCAIRRARNEVFAVRAILQRDYSTRVDAIMPKILSSYRSLDDRRSLIEAIDTGSLNIDGVPANTIPVYAASHLRLMQAAIRLADRLIVSSESERRRVAEIIGSQPPKLLMNLRDPHVPSPSATGLRKSDTIVIWAPHSTGDAAALFSIALSELRIPIVVVSATPPSDPTLATWVAAAAASEALGRARALIDATPFGSDAALALAAWGVPLICDVESGAQERFDNVHLYDRRRHGSIFEATIAALGSSPPVPSSPSSPFESIESIRGGAPIAEGPLVSVIIPTFDRPQLVRNAVESVRRQTYRNVETIVVIDGGLPLDEITRQYPDVRIIAMTENNLRASINHAYEQSHGEYIAFLNDDDVYFPNHLSELVSALERSRCSVAHGDVLTAVLKGEGDDWWMCGLESNMSRATNASALLVSNQIGATSVLFRRSCIAEGPLLPHDVLLYVDYELWLRLAVQYDLVHVEKLTSCYTIRNDGAGQQSNMWYDRSSASYRMIYELHPVGARPQLESSRQAILARVESGQMLLKTEPAAVIEPVRWPLWQSD